MSPPPWLNDPSALVLVDWSWWCNRAFHGPSGLDGMLPLLVGWLTGSLLSWEPAHLALALDSPGETWRHAKRHPTDPDWRYKGQRPAKPEAFHEISAVATKLAEMHGIPCLWCDATEADDIIATATARARAAGYRVWIASADKDLHHLVEDEVRMWNPFPRDGWETREPADVRAAFGVEPAQIADWLAIVGDASDGVPGVGQGLGPTRAAAILGRYGTLAEALAAPVWTSTKFAEIDREIDDLAKLAKKKPIPWEWGPIPERREALKVDRQIERWRLTLSAHRELATFSRELTALDCDAPLDMPWEDLPLGGYDVEAIRAWYTRHGMSRKAAEVPLRTKRAPWRLPWRSEDMPRRKGAGDEHQARAQDGALRSERGAADTPRDQQAVGRGGDRALYRQASPSSARPGHVTEGVRSNARGDEAVRRVDPPVTPHPLLLAAAVAAEQLRCPQAAEALRRAAKDGADPATVARTLLRPALAMDGVDVERIEALVRQIVPPGQSLVLCSYSRCADEHGEALRLVVGIATPGDAIGAIAAIRRLPMLELHCEEHAQLALARWAKLESRAA